MAIGIEFRSGLNSECHTLSSACYITHHGIETVSSLKIVRVVNALDIIISIIGVDQHARAHTQKLNPNSALILRSPLVALYNASMCIELRFPFCCRKCLRSSYRCN